MGIRLNMYNGNNALHVVANAKWAMTKHEDSPWVKAKLLWQVGYTVYRFSNHIAVGNAGLLWDQTEDMNYCKHM